MSDQPEPTPPPSDDGAIAQQLRLRPDWPRVTRLSRKVLIGLGAAGSVAVLGATIWALQPSRRSGGGQELYSTDNKTTADGLVNLPRDYTGLPRNVPPLGPPLPGDLGRPIVAAQQAGQPVTVPAMPTSPAVDPEEQRRAQEREAARLPRADAAFRKLPWFETQSARLRAARSKNSSGGLDCLATAEGIEDQWESSARRPGSACGQIAPWELAAGSSRTPARVNTIPMTPRSPPHLRSLRPICLPASPELTITVGPGAGPKARAVITDRFDDPGHGRTWNKRRGEWHSMPFSIISLSQNSAKPHGPVRAPVLTRLGDRRCF